MDYQKRKGFKTSSLNGGRMLKIKVIYASMSGNTETIADIIAAVLKEQNHDVDVMDILTVQS